MMMVVKVAGVMNPPSLTVEGNRRNSHRKSFCYCHSFFFFFFARQRWFYNAGFILFTFCGSVVFSLFLLGQDNVSGVTTHFTFLFRFFFSF